MSGLRFKVGELAIFAVAATVYGLPYVGETVEVVKAGKVMGHKGPGDYATLKRDGSVGVCFDWQLRKIDPPAEPASLTRNEECEVTA